MDGYSVILFNENNEKKHYPIDHYCVDGTYGYVYRIDDDTCIKLFSDDFSFDLSIIKTVRDLKLTNFYQIYDILFDSDNHYSGYTMKYYQSEDVDIIKMPTSYTLDNLYRLYDAIEKLTKKGIYAYDFDVHNVIMNNKDITAIDVDIYYYYDEAKKEQLAKDNYKLLLHLFKALYYEKIKMLGFSFQDNEDLLNYLFDENKEISNIEKKLIKYKYPIDYIRRKMGEC